MLSKKSQISTLFVVNGLLLACASPNPHRQTNSGEGVYFDSAFNDHNKAPLSMSPPALAKDGDPIDPVFLRTQADYYFQVGEGHSLNGEPQKAVEAFKTVLVYDSKSSHVHLRLAAEYVKSGMLTQAVEHAEIASKQNPESVNAHILLGGLLSTLKVYERAISHYEKALRIEPSNTEAAMYIGAVYAEQKQYEKAAKYFEKLAKSETYGTPYLAWYYLGRVRSEQTGKAFERSAESAFQKCLSLKPDYVEAILALGALYTKANQQSKAIALYNKYQREQGPHPKLASLLADHYLEQDQYDMAYEQLEVLEQYSEDAISTKLRMALTLISQKNYEKAVIKLKEVLRQVPESDKIRFYLGAVYEEMGKATEAIEYFTRIPAESQYFGESTVHAAYLLKQNGRLGEATNLVKNGIEKRPDVAQFYSIYASLLDEKGEYHKALTVLESGTKKFPENVQLKFFLGTVSDRLGNKKKVVEHMRKVIEMDPNHVQGLNYLAFTYAEANDNLEEAEKLVRRALAIEPQDGYILDTLGWILYKKGQFQESIKILEAAIRHQPNESIIAEHLGDAYHKFRLVDKERQMYLKAAETETNEKKLKEIQEKITILEHQEMKLTDRHPASSERVQPKEE